MIPHSGIYGLLGALLVSGALGMVARPKRTDADRLRELDEAERKAIERANNPHVIAAAQRRERRRLKRMALS